MSEFRETSPSIGPWEKHVEHVRPRCPRCQSLDYESYKTRTDRYGIDTLYVRCRECEFRYAILNL